ncbi:MAG: HDOD domain-containing protein [Acidobacteriota bacterium]
MVFEKLRERAAFATGNFGKLFAHIEIPPLPQVAVRLLSLVRQEDVDFSRVAKVIASDAGISARVLRTVNSAFFGVARQVTDIQHAVSLLGQRRIYSLALAYAAIDTLGPPAEGEEAAQFWCDSIQRAVFAQTLASRVSPGEEGEAFTGGLLQDLAQPILLNQWRSHYLPVLEEARHSDRDLASLEEERFSWNHAQGGAWIARNWQFQDLLVCCIGLHNAIPRELEKMSLAGTSVIAVAVSSRLPDAASFCHHQLEIDSKTYRGLCEVTDAAVEELAELLNIPPPEPLAPSQG